MSVAQSSAAPSGEQRFRQVMGRFATGVVVVTAQGPTGPVGITCQSFASLSLDPPLILFCPSSTSWAWGQIRDAGRFCVNILGEHQRDLGTSFAGRVMDKFAGVAFSAAPSGSPLLDEVSAWVDCDLHAVHPGGDHDVVVGAVTAMGLEADGRPLVYHQGSFGAFVPAEPWTAGFGGGRGRRGQIS